MDRNKLFYYFNRFSAKCELLLNMKCNFIMTETMFYKDLWFYLQWESTRVSNNSCFSIRILSCRLAYGVRKGNKQCKNKSQWSVELNSWLELIHTRCATMTQKRLTPYDGNLQININPRFYSISYSSFCLWRDFVKTIMYLDI